MSKHKAAILDSSLLVRRGGSVTTLRLRASEPARTESSTLNATVRVSQALHRRLRVMATHSHRTQQAIIRDALKQYLDERGEAEPACACMRQQQKLA